MPDVTKADLQAIRDVAEWLGEQSDSMSAQQAVELIHEAEITYRALGTAISLLKTQALRSIEQPILVGNTVWAKKAVYKKRPDQTLIARVVAETSSLADANGEVPTVTEVAEKVVRKMTALYVSPSTVPKVGGVKALGLEMDDVCRDEHTGFELRSTVIE